MNSKNKPLEITKARHLRGVNHGAMQLWKLAYIGIELDHTSSCFSTDLIVLKRKLTAYHHQDLLWLRRRTPLYLQLYLSLNQHSLNKV